MKKTIVAVALAVFFVLAIAAPAFAIVHVATYDMDGDIYMDKQVGHFCNTGAEQLQTIRGTGKMTKDMTVRMIKGRVTVVDHNDFVTAPDAVRNLVVTSVITLCTPPKLTYETPGGDVAVVQASALYHPAGPNQPFEWGLGGLSGANWDMIVDENDWDTVSDQIWAVRVEANPGFSGNLHQDWEAAYGRFWTDPMAQYKTAGVFFDEEDDWFNNESRWRWEIDDDGVVSPGLGDNYPGDYFRMNQMARTSSGDVKRYIDISSPWSGAYLYEDFEVAGFAEIMDTFNMTNLPAGEDMPATWWKDLFDK